MYNKFYTKKVHEKILLNEIATVNLSQIYLLKNSEKIFKTNNHDLNRDWKTAIGIEKYVLMTAFGDNHFLRAFPNGYFLKAATKTCFFSLKFQ